ncbi:zinc finger protein 687b [Denticeps clupeoides]|uniref:C2H2-type domain-containing protein n=1 Tax=Denticeps clupeoides TaxID=299321 RepID=A0AAY4DAM3_9TELE|nr:zinc finger protein 687 [Denticeps clupeoides]XP_028820239.1 zinc finger protein 687 [Denticeps clupeoides]
MGDMKTPDFDDLLAAFDIPDIDAKEAIQSARDDVEGHHGAGSGTLGKPGESETDGGANMRPPSPVTDPHVDPSIVSVIVKNRVRLEGGDGPASERETPDGASVGIGSRLSSRSPGLAPGEPLNHNGFGSTSGPPSLNQGQSNGEPWALCAPKAVPDAGGFVPGSAGPSKHTTVLFNKLKPLMSQGAGDPVGRARKMQLLQQQHMQQEAGAEEPEKQKGPTIPGRSSGMVSPFLPPPKALFPAPSSSSTLSHNPHHSVGSVSPQSFNGSLRLGASGYRRLDSEEEDSDAELGGPLVIQESPDSPTCMPPKLAHRVRSPAGGFESTSLPASASASSYPKPGDVPLTSPASPQAQQNWPQLPAQMGTSKGSPEEDLKQEHVIDERDSPESPEPEIPKSSATSSATKRSSSPVVASTLPSLCLREPKEEEEEMEVDKSDSKAQENRGTDNKKGDVPEDREKDAVDGGGATSVTGDGTAPVGPASSRPLKVRIKTIKTPTGSITRTVVASKGAGLAAGKNLDPSKSQPGARTVAVNRVRKTNAAGRKSSVPLPVSTLEASSAMIAAATKVQSKMAVSSKTKVSTTAVSITKTATLPVTSVVSGISVRPVASKTANGGAAVVQQPCKPASIVNSTGAVISRSQSSLVEAFNKILNSKNLLPSYRPDLSTPPPPEWGLPMPASGYRCLECGDTFALERSLVRHYDRRSLRIEVTCNHCAKRLAFFNKCSLLLHAREHKERGLVMQCSHLVMRPVTVEQMIGQLDATPIGVVSPSLSASTAPSQPPQPSASSSSSPLKGSPSPVTSPSQPGSTRRGPNSPQPVLPLACKKGEALQYNNFKCPECQAQFASKAELVGHFQQLRATPNSTCMLCTPPMMLPNWCSVSAHQRVHKHRAPHVCPECGGTAKQTSFQTHLEESCLHFARRIGYRCSSCQVVFGGLNSIKSHIQTAHCEVFHKCPNCPMAFKSAPSVQAHISTQHPTLTGAQAKMIYKCVMCDTVFTQKALLYMHFDTHLAKQKVHVFKCPDCTKLYVQKGSMMEHIKTVHRSLSVKQEASVPGSASSPTPTSTSTSSHPPPKTKAPGKTDPPEGEEWSEGQEEEEQQEEEGEEKEEEEENEGDDPPSSPEPGVMEWRCRECRTHYSEREDYISHMRKEHGKPMKKFPCRMCERSFSSANSLRRHVRVIHEGNKRVFHCQYCSEGKRTFSSRLILEKHIRVRHGIRGRQPADRQGPPNTRKRSAAAEGVGSSSEQDMEAPGEESPAKRTRAAAAAAAGDPQHGPEPQSSGASHQQDEDEGAFRCAPCGFTTEDWEEFQRHIPQHLASLPPGSLTSLQCQQCGACFASAGSLARHRFITHRVRDERRPSGGASAAASPPGSAPQASSPRSSPSSPRPGDDGGVSCRVCGLSFDKLSNLNTHFRTHGMAFIAAHKTDKPA